MMSEIRKKIREMSLDLNNAVQYSDDGTTTDDTEVRRVANCLEDMADEMDAAWRRAFGGDRK